MPYRPLRVRDRRAIERILRRNPALHVYELGDLDDAFWPAATWYASEPGPAAELILYYTGTALPVLLALSDLPGDALRHLLASLAAELPGRLYAHLSPGLVDVLGHRYRAESHGVHLKMALVDPARCEAADVGGTERLAARDLPELGRCYDAAYPGHWFEPRMLERGCYYGIRRDGRLVSVAGTHVHSARFRVAALGNIATLPEYRRQGLAAACCARLCTELRGTADHIGLNVRADDPAAVGLYTGLGFERIGKYEEFMLSERA